MNLQSRRLPNPPKDLAEKIRLSLDLFPCDLLFIHRDAERELHEVRVAEIRKAVKEATKFVAVPPQVCVVPIRMQEAWLLFDEAALRRAGGNPNGKHPLQLPPLDKIEHLPNPKTIFMNSYVRQADFTALGEKNFGLMRVLIG